MISEFSLYICLVFWLTGLVLGLSWWVLQERKKRFKNEKLVRDLRVELDRSKIQWAKIDAQANHYSICASRAIDQCDQLHAEIATLQQRLKDYQQKLAKYDHRLKTP